MSKVSSVKPVFFLLLILVLTFWAYFPGLKGGFLFDDFPNLQELRTYGGVQDLNSLRAYVLSGFSGPTGRPLSLLSFLLNDNTWPSDAYSFKLTNLWIHLLTGLVLCWATLLLLRFYGLTSHRVVWVAVISSAIWLLHPYFVSTTLYVVQRMAQLATLFMLAGIAGYLHGRLTLKSRPRSAYLWMTASVGLGTLLAVLSKENGALLPLLIMVLDFCKPANTFPRPATLWRAVVIWLPALTVLIALGRIIDFSPDLWPSRNFNQPERLLSEARIVCEYIFHLYIPQIEGRGLFQDGFEVSRGWFRPASTFVAVIGILALFISALLLRKRLPLYSFAVIFFFTSHLMESSVVGLELYFEHRNYSAAAFLFLPLAAALVHFSKAVKPSLALGITASLFAVLAFMTWQRASLWGDTQKLELYWAVSTPNSARAQNAVAAYLFDQGRSEEANIYLEAAMDRLPNSSLLTIRLLLQKVYSGVATQAEFASAAGKLSKQPFDAQALVGLRTLTDFLIAPTAGGRYLDDLNSLVDAMSSNASYQRIPVFIRLAPYLKAQIYLAKGDPDKAYVAYAQAMALYADTEAALMMVTELARGGYQEYALKLLPQALEIYRAQKRSNLRRTMAEYNSEFARLKADLHEDIANKTTKRTLI